MPIIIWKSLNKKTPPNYPQCFCRCCSEALECLCFHFHQQKTTDGCVLLGQHKASETSLSNCPSVLTSPSSCRKGVCDLTLCFFELLFLTVCLLHGYVWTVLAASGSPFPAGARCFAGLGSLHLVATNTFWNVCFLLRYRFVSLGHFSIIRMLMRTSSCSLLVKLMYLEVIHIFPFSGFSNKRFKLFYVVLLNTIFCAAFLCFSLEVPLLQFALSF